jgi:hypothetical protein
MNGNPARKIRLLEMAQRWAHLAEVAERNALLLRRHVYRNSAPGEDNKRNRADRYGVYHLPLANFLLGCGRRKERHRWLVSRPLRFQPPMSLLSPCHQLRHALHDPGSKPDFQRRIQF